MKEICPIEFTLQILKSKWSFLIIRELIPGTKRFNQIQKSLDGITQKVLTTNLRFLEEKNIISRVVYPVIPPKVEYSLTQYGKTLGPVLDSLKNWGEGNNK